MRSKNYGINVRVTEQEKQKLLENARFCSLSAASDVYKRQVLCRCRNICGGWGLEKRLERPSRSGITACFGC